MNAILLRFICFFCLIGFFFCNPVSANIYRYTDSNGDTHYSNNPTEIPRKYHDSIVIEHEVKYEEPEPSPAEPDKKTGISDHGNDSVRSKVNYFRARERELANEYESLQKEKVELDKAQEEASTPVEIVTNNNRIRDFNRRLEEYRKKREALEKEINEHNTMVKESFEESLRKVQEAQKKD